MAGYSATPLPKELGIKPGHRVALIDPHPAAAGLLRPLPPGATPRDNLRSHDTVDVAVLFCRSQSALQRRFPRSPSALPLPANSGSPDPTRSTDSGNAGGPNAPGLDR